jgi:5-methylcytosine-specific restriction endonuclease McrA
VPPAKLKVCAEHGCSELTTEYRCQLHAAQERKTAQTWVYSDPRWKAARRYVRFRQPVCAIPGCYNLTQDVDHIVPLREHGDPFNIDNLQGLCRHHHNIKTRGGGA